MEMSNRLVEGSPNNQNSQILFRTANEICGEHNAKMVCVNDKGGQSLENHLFEKKKLRSDGQNTIGNYTTNKIPLMKLYSENYKIPTQQNT